MLDVQINHIDHYLAPPGALDNADGFSAVPVLRIFGPSSLGQKCCLHIHQVYPYFYVEYNGSLTHRRKGLPPSIRELPLLSSSTVNRYITKLTKSLNLALALSFKKDLTTARQQSFIRAIILVKGVPFYGFHSSYAPFLKIYLLNPALLTRAVTILRSGVVLSTHFRTFESHLSFPLQFLTDFGLHGCGWLNLGDAYKRGQDEEETSALKISSYYCQTKMSLEVDAAGFHILNRHQLVARNMHHKLDIPAPPLPPEPLVLGVRELWDDERRRRRARGLNPTPDMPVDPSDASRTPRGPWLSEARWWDAIRKRIEDERTLEPDPPLQHEWEEWAVTAFESVGSLWPGDHPNSGLQVSGVDADDVELLDSDVSFTPDQISQLEADEDALQKELERDVSPEVDADQEAEDDEELQSEKSQSPTTTASDPFDVNDETTLSEGGLFLSSPPDVDAFIDFDEPTTPTRSRFPDIQLMGTSPEPGSGDSQLAADSSGGNPPAKKRRLAFNLAGRSIAYLVSHNAMTVKTKIKPIGTNCYEFSNPPPTRQALREILDVSDIASKVYQAAFYSDDDDVQRPRFYGGLRYDVPGNPESLLYLEEWVDDLSPAFDDDQSILPLSGGWEYAESPPSSRQTRRWLAVEGRIRAQRRLKRQSQIEGPTLKNIYGLKSLPVVAPGAASARGAGTMSVLSLEIFVPCSNNGKPQQDGIAAAFIAFRDGDVDEITSKIVFVRDAAGSPDVPSCTIQSVATELELINAVVDTVLDLDPDILVGWEVQNASWGYLTERSRCLDLDIVPLLSRTNSSPNSRDDRWSAQQNSSFKVVGRHVLNLWRVMRSEVTLSIYTFENVAFHTLGRRLPHFSSQTLKLWHEDPSPEHAVRVFSYFSQRSELNLAILEATEVVTKTAEFARVFGVEWFSVLSRGSQFKVESFMFRIAKPENFILLSPSREDVGRQNAAEAMPLILEPQSTFYNNPVLVLDFQSLYPSIMIAENYCYSTFVGRVKKFQNRQKFGVDPDLDLAPGYIESLAEHITVSPTGMMFVKPEVRKGLLGRMLTELLDTRVMVKYAMKSAAVDKVGDHVAVTYGYTSATFSGRMPAVEIADSIVQSGRETLEKAISVINNEPRWGAHVVYGDTDSVFVHLPGKTKEQAFRIGNEISETITSMNPSPVKLKFEKVYLPCVLLAKKRYVGYRFDQPDDVEPIFDAKGIETVRRDGVAAQRKMTEAVLHMLFRTQDLSNIKDYCTRSWQRILEGKVTIEDYIFAKEVRLGGYSDKAPPPPGAVVAARLALEEDAEAQYKERVRYVICNGSGRLVDRAYAPAEVVENRSLRLDASYYISRVLIPPLDRILSLAGADVRKWFDEMPQNFVYTESALSPTKSKPKPANDNPAYLIDENFYRSQCLACEMPSETDICDDCLEQPEVAMARVLAKMRKGETRLLDITRICASCCQTPAGEPIECDSLDCSWFYARRKAEARLDFLQDVQNIVFDGIAE
ncbi:DNA polymerase [Mycena chlorophos]|uniref:DNA polymerase n=1 Tax=Mycena chlorophos TaxID=658473 RepID=A0A8H6WC32_MYCCL|nr:DNA polymerase [Mycena chlorophos]